MFKKILTFTLFIFLANCSAPGTAFLGPIFTGATTGSVSQASLSYTSNKILEEIKSNQNINKISKFKKKNIKSNPTLPDTPYTTNDPVILLAYKVNKIYISDVAEPETLP